MTAKNNAYQGFKIVCKDIAQGFFDITHNGFALLGLAVMFASITLLTQPEMRQESELKLMGWLQERQVGESDLMAEVEDAAFTPASLTKEQAAMAQWLSKKYRVAYDPMQALVAEVYQIGARHKVDPALILAVMAIESSFNPFAQSSAGAQGLMQVMTRVHIKQYDDYGGKLAAFHPVPNIQVGVKILKDCIARAGSIEGGLKHYVGAANMTHDGGYGAKVLAEYRRIQAAAQGARKAVKGPADLSNA
jgi:soluble lytic murein transglycosylase-like protein